MADETDICYICNVGEKDDMKFMMEKQCGCTTWHPIHWSCFKVVREKKDTCDLCKYKYTFQLTSNKLIQDYQKSYYLSGNIESKGALIDGKKSGLWVYYYDKPGKNKQLEGYYVNGQKHDLWREYYESGKLKVEIRYNKGGLFGEMKEYYKSGSLKIHTQYVYGKLLGFYKKYYESGALNEEGNYQYDKKEGKWKKYETVVTDIEYVNGEVVSTDQKSSN